MAKTKNGRVAKHSLSPIQKVIPVVSPDKIPEGTATLDDYENMAKKIAMSSDEIIDKVLDKMEGNQSNSITSCKPDKVQEIQNTPTEPSVEVVDKELPPQQVTPEEVTHNGNSTEISVCVEDTVSADTSNDVGLQSVKSEDYGHLLKYHNMEDRCKELTIEMKKLEDKCDDLLLRNSELEFEISRLNIENASLKKQLEQYQNEKRLPPQTYSRENYSRLPSQMSQRVPRQIRHPTMGMNGYESWN